MFLLAGLECGECDNKADDDHVENGGGQDGKPAAGERRDDDPVDEEEDVGSHEDREFNKVARAKCVDFEPHLVHGDVREEEEEKVGEPEEAQHGIRAERSDGEKPVRPCNGEVVLDPHEVHRGDEEDEQKEHLPNVDMARNSPIARESIERTPEDLHGRKRGHVVAVDKEVE